MIEREQIDDILVLRLAHGKANTFNIDFLAALERAIDDAARDGAGAIVFTGAGSIFSAGVDLFELASGGVEHVEKFLPPLSSAFRALFLSPVPVVGAINGHAIAGGCILAQCCDYRLISGGRIGVSELLVGVAFPPLALEIMRFAVAPQHLQKLVLTGVTVPAADAVAHGLADELVPPERLMDRALEVARALASVPRETFRVTKEHLRHEVLDRATRAESQFGERIDAIWRAPETMVTLRAYAEKAVSKKP